MTALYDLMVDPGNVIIKVFQANQGGTIITLDCANSPKPWLVKPLAKRCGFNIRWRVNRSNRKRWYVVIKSSKSPFSFLEQIGYQARGCAYWDPLSAESQSEFVPYSCIRVSEEIELCSDEICGVHKDQVIRSIAYQLREFQFIRDATQNIELLQEYGFREVEDHFSGEGGYYKTGYGGEFDLTGFYQTAISHLESFTQENILSCALDIPRELLESLIIQEKQSSSASVNSINRLVAEFGS